MMTASMNEQSKSATIPVVYACDAGYVLPTIISIVSLLKNKKAGTNIQVCVIAEDTAFSAMRPALDSLCAYYETPSVLRLEPSGFYENQTITIGHTTRTTYYRLDLPTLLPDIEKCVYLDGDTIILDDIGELFQSITDEQYLAGVKAAAYYYPLEKQQEKAARLLIDELTDYINAGVLVMNLDTIRKDAVQKKWNGLLKFEPSSQDQDILNSACHDRIALLPPKFNLMTKYHPADTNSYTDIPSISLCWTKEEWREACITPVVIHYADRVKPWQNTSVDFSDLWWEYAELAESLTSFTHGFLPVLRASANRAAASTQEYESEKEALEKQLEKKGHDYQALQALKNSLAEEKTSLTQEKSALIKERDILVKERDSLLGNNTKLQAKRTSLEKRVETLDGKLAKSREQTNQTKKKIDEMRTSRSWKIGRAITLIPRKIKRLFKH